MRFWLYLIVGIAALLALGYVVSAVIGLLVWAVIAVVVGSVIVGLLKGGSSNRLALKSPGRREQKKIEQGADRALKELETKVTKE